MAFTGEPVVTQVSQSLVRITGLSLGSGAEGTISLDEGAGEVKLPDGCNWKPYSSIDLAEAVEISWVFVDDPGALDQSTRIYVAKAAGGDPVTFLATMTNGDTSEAQSAEMEIYVRFHN